MKYFFALLVISLVACNRADTQLEEENKSLKHQVGSLQEQLAKKEVTPNRDNLEEFEQNVEARYEYLTFASELLLSDDKLVSEVVYQLFENINTNEFLYNLSFLINSGHHSHLVNQEDAKAIKTSGLVYDESFYFFYLWSRLDKSPENITELYNRFGKWGVEYIPHLDELQLQELIDLTSALILSYEEVGTDTEWLESMYLKTDTVSVLSDLTYFEKVSPEVDELLNVYGNENDIAYDRWTYSFWVRRHHERNAAVFYSILKDVNTHLTNQQERVDY